LQVLWQVAIAVLVVWLVFRFVRSRFNPRQPADAIEDPFAVVPSPKKRGPPNRAGAVALEEPEQDDEQIYPPRLG
jgi:hypothetical protein